MARQPYRTTTTSPRTMADRTAQVFLDGDTTAHVTPARMPSEYVDIRTACGVDSPKGDHRPGRFLPLSEATCGPCVTAALAVPFEHRVVQNRVRLGTGAIRGSGMKYGTTASCTCDADEKWNTAPSSGGTGYANAWQREHLDRVDAGARHPDADADEG